MVERNWMFELCFGRRAASPRRRSSHSGLLCELVMLARGTGQIAWCRISKSLDSQLSRIEKTGKKIRRIEFEIAYCVDGTDESLGMEDDCTRTPEYGDTKLIAEIQVITFFATHLQSAVM